MTFFKRYLKLPKHSFFLLGPRGTGKSTWLDMHVPAALKIDLLESDRYLEMTSHPESLRHLASPLKAGDWVVIDEIQRIPGLLNEVHWLYQKKKIRFAITGSSARKLKRTQANLLAGRLLDIRFFPLVYPELEKAFDLSKCLNLGTLPGVASNYNLAIEILASYLATYLRQELLEEAVIRKLDPFRRFLDTVGLLNGQLINKENIARESSVKRPTVEHYFGILEDTLLGGFIEAFRPGQKAKEVAFPKFYLFDTGVVRSAAGLLNQQLESEFLGFMFETFLLNQLRAYLSYHQYFFPIYHYTVSHSYDIDFIVMIKKPVMSKKGSLVCIEAKYGTKFKEEWIRGITDFRSLSKHKVESAHIVYGGNDVLEVDNVKLWPVAKFLSELFAGKILP